MCSVTVKQNGYDGRVLAHLFTLEETSVRPLLTEGHMDRKSDAVLFTDCSPGTGKP